MNIIQIRRELLRLKGVDEKTNKRIDALESKLNIRLDAMQAEIDSNEARLTAGGL